MKVANFLSFIGLLATGALASPAPAEAAAEAARAAECGSLGVMKVDVSELPEGIDPSGIRRCAEHPLGRYPGLAPEDMSDAPGLDVFARHDEADDDEDDLVSLKPRACYTAAASGCSGGYCWKQCGLRNSGEWCWTAQLAGLGSWNTCTTSAQCTTLQTCGIGICRSCGCSC